MKLMIEPHKFTSQQKYRDALFALLVKYEGDKKYLHIGPKGVPTIGPGIELIVKDGVYKPRNRGKIDEILTAAHGRSTKLSAADWLWLGKAANLMQNGGLKPEQLKVEMSKLMNGHGIKPFIGAGLRRLFNVAVGEAEKGVGNSLRQAVHELNADKSTNLDPNAVIAAFANSHEFLSLVSQRYNNVRSPKAIAALLNGNRAEAYLEIAYRSNGSKEAGFVKRRMEEAADVLGDSKAWTPDQKRQWNDVFTRNRAEIETYEKQFGANIPQTGFFSHHVKQAGHTLPAGSDVRRVSVHPGETLGGIAKREGVSVQDLMKANNISR